MKQLLIPSDKIIKNTITLNKEIYHYLINVRRYSIGQELKGIDDKDQEYSLIIQDIREGEVQLSIHKLDKNKTNTTNIILVPFLLKGKKLEDVIRHATEMGINIIQPVEGRYCIAKISDKEESKLKRWQKISIEAVQQSGSSKVPTIRQTIKFSQLNEHIPDNYLKLFFHQEPLEQESLHSYLSQSYPGIALIIGPEGGLAAEEVNEMRSWNYKPVFLGSNILRAETASLYATAAVKTIIQEKSSWKTL
ncbi:RsmE family RNA methyltransferase [Spirochaeta cellobiosiphila]|uniref:RsmE family RNA methyltransferase n=1 Tax=Spirochaeta cellobiosiphila TaxID=504483 RepID=UPI00040A32A0|nr:RsmE family RNA methyltransferase [Spirochaeta cellobiosiphila]